MKRAGCVFFFGGVWWWLGVSRSSIDGVLQLCWQRLDCFGVGCLLQRWCGAVGAGQAPLDNELGKCASEERDDGQRAGGGNAKDRGARQEGVQIEDGVVNG